MDKSNKKYYTFLRSCRNWEEFANAEKVIQETDLTAKEAYDACVNYNQNLTEKEQEDGTKLEFTEED